MQFAKRFAFYAAIFAMAVLAASPLANATTIISCGTIASPTSCTGTGTTGEIYTFSNFTFAGGIPSGVGTGPSVTSSDVGINLDLLDDGGATIDFFPTVLSAWGPYTQSQLLNMAMGFELSYSGPVGISIVTSSFTDLFTGVGTGSETKTLCLGGPCLGGGTPVSAVNLNDTGGKAGVQGTYSGTVAPPFSAGGTGTVWGYDSLNLNADNNTIQASNVSDTFDTPEPGSMFLAGGGLIALGVFTRRKRRAANGA